ncbi:ABC transporter ATP-binding protein [Pseudogracilibacillus sp. SE30717A]|uniref:ABC transporter ATP-binding protein n=1 Tax=Pseudogracilibacillus sp. SE30717A TaxID=3098293 RepID=UPI00300E02BA
MLSIKHLRKSYGATNALKNISIDFNEGSCFGLIGPNGAGKSTLMKILVGIIERDEGIIKSKHTKKEIGYVPQELCLEENVSALQNLLFFGKLYHLKGTALKKRAEEVLDSVGLTERKKDKVKTFSGGMKRRLNIGCALMNNPRLIIMDEPTVGIDPQSRQFILKMVEQMKKENRTIIYSTHYIEEAEKVCDEVAFIDKGEIVQQDSIEDLLRNHAIPSIYFKLQEPYEKQLDIHTFGDVEAYKNGYMLSTKNPMLTMENMLQISKEKKVIFEHFELMQPRLEDVFFKITGTELRA